MVAASSQIRPIRESPRIAVVRRPGGHATGTCGERSGVWHVCGNAPAGTGPRGVYLGFGRLDVADAAQLGDGAGEGVGTLMKQRRVLVLGVSGYR
jgi:hypothetical protein